MEAQRQEDASVDPRLAKESERDYVSNVLFGMSVTSVLVRVRFDSPFSPCTDWCLGLNYHPFWIV